MIEKAKILRHIIRLANDDFTLSANQASYESEVATHIVPAKRMYEIPDNFIGLKLMTKDHFTFTTGAAETTHVCTLTYPIAEDKLITMVGQNVIVVITTPATGEVTTFTVTQPKTVTLSGLAVSTAYVVDIYYLFKDGSVNISVVSSDETAKTKILEGAIGMINQLNEEDVRIGLKPGMVGLCIPERWKIQLKVITAASIIFYGATETAYSSPYARESFFELPVNVSNLLHWPTGIKQYAKSQLMGV